MPAGPEPLGLVYFAAVKFAGYAAAASFLNREFPESRTSVWVVGAVRTVIGLGAGLAAVFSLGEVGILRSQFAFYGWLAPVRMCEWLILLALFYRRPEWHWWRSLRFSVWGALWSYVLDMPAVLAVITVPGGVWIC